MRAFIRALGFDQVDLLGFSMGGFVAQVIAAEHPDLVRKVILAGTGPAGGEGIDKVTMLTYIDMAKGAATFRDAKYYLFFTDTANGRSEARAGLPEEGAHAEPRQGHISIPRGLSRIPQPVFVANGDHDRMVPTQNSADLARRLPNAKLTIYPDAGHGGIFQYHDSFAPEALEFLATA